MSQTFNRQPYTSGHLRAMITIALLGAGALANALSLIVNVALVGTLRGADEPSAPYEIGESVTELLYVGVALLQFVIFVATIVAFLMWIQRAYRNLPALGAVRLDTTPGWVVGYFFIPIVNFFKPFQAVREIWRHSLPLEESDEGLIIAARSGGHALVGWWWAFWIVATLVGRAGDRAVRRASSIEGMLLASRVSIAADGLYIIAAVLAILVVKRIDEMQEAKFRQMTTQTPPPPPESFETTQTP
jgi:hypothetical protein